MLSLEEKKALLEIARRAIHDQLVGAKATAAPPSSPRLLSKKGAFVTLTREGELRGCIGRIDPQLPLFQMVSEMARAAAFNDPRFRPLTFPELSGTVIEVSILTPLERLLDLRVLEVGRHGLVVRRGVSSGLLLPQVASDNGWSAEEFLRQVCIKAALPRDAWREKGTELFSFTAEVFSEEDVQTVPD